MLCEQRAVSLDEICPQRKDLTTKKEQMKTNKTSPARLKGHETAIDVSRLKPKAPIPLAVKKPSAWETQLTSSQSKTL